MKNLTALFISAVKLSLYPWDLWCRKEGRKEERGRGQAGTGIEENNVFSNNFPPDFFASTVRFALLEPPGE